MRQRPLTLVFVLLFLAACGSEPAPREPAIEAALPTPGPSVVFGPTDAPEGGVLRVGLLVPAPLSRRLVDLVPAEAYAAFLAAEASREDDAEEVEIVEEIDLWGGDLGGYGRSTHSSRRRAAESVEEKIGLRVVFHHVLPEECADLPFVLVEERALYPNEVEVLQAYEQRGGRVLRNQSEVGDVGTACPGIVPGEGHDHGALLDACLQAIRTSAFVHRLPADPLRVVSAERVGTEIRAKLAGKPREATLRNLANEALARVEIGSDGALRFDCPDPGLDPYTHRLVATWSQGDLVLRRAWHVVDLVGTAERRVFTSRLVEAGATYAPRVTFTNTLSGDPVEGREERLALVQGARTLAEATATSGPAGSLDVALTVPEDTEPGPATLRVGNDTFPVEIRRGSRVSIVTDRTLYKSIDEVHVRLMVHTASLGRPVADRQVILRHGSVEKRVTTSVHGIASTTFHLRAERLGTHEIVASVDGASATARFDVRAFERPTYLLVFEPERLVLRPGEEAPVVLVATYVNGSPMSDAKVWSWDNRRLGHESVGGKTDAQGRFELTVKASQRARSGVITFEVHDADGRKEAAKLPVEIERSEPLHRVEVTLLDEPVSGLPCRFQVTATKPGPLVLDVPGEEARTVTVDASCSAVFEVVPRSKELALRLTPTEGRPFEHSFRVHLRQSDAPLLVLPKRVWRVGEQLTATVHAPDGPVYVEVARDGSLLRGTSAVVKDGRATLTLPLAPDLAGPLMIWAWRPVEEEPRGSRLRILVTRDRRLAVKAEAEREAYRPGETAVVNVDVRDRAGAPTAAVLGYWGVDEALLAIAPWSDGREEIFDVLGPRADARRAAIAASTERGGDVPFHEARSILGTLDTVYLYSAWRALGIRHRDRPGRERAYEKATQEHFEAWFEKLQQTYLDAFRKVPLEELRTAHSLREVLRDILRRGHLETRHLVDPWGTPLDVGHGLEVPGSEYAPRLVDSNRAGVPCRSAGPDLVLATADDPFGIWRLPTAEEIGGRLGRFLSLCREHASFGLLEQAPFWGPTVNGTIGIGGGAGGAFRGRGGSRDLGTGGGGRKLFDGPVHVRKDFAPTLCFIPEAVVGPTGKARLEIPLKDSITTWGLRLVASDADGATGVGFGSIRVTQPLHVQPWLATHLTVGDELELPVAVRNETPAAVTVALRLALSAELEAVGPVEATVVVAAGGTEAHRFRFRAVARGDGRVRIDAQSDRHRDAVERIVHVRPDAREVVDVLHATLAPDRPWQGAFGALSAEAPREYRLSTYASPMANLVGGLEGLLTCPHG